MEKFKLIENELVEKYGDNSSINLANGEVVSNENKEIEQFTLVTTRNKN